MASLNDANTKSAIELVKEYLDRLNILIEEHNTSISKTRDNLLNCIESNKKSTQNSAKRCNQTIQEIDAQIKALIPKYSAENEKIQEKNEARIASNNETIEEYKKEEARCIYKYEAKLGGNKNNLKGKQIFSWEIPEYVLNTGGKIRYTQRLGELISSYFDLYTGHVDVRFGSGQFSFRKSQNKLIEQVKVFMRLLSGK